MLFKFGKSFFVGKNKVKAQVLLEAILAIFIVGIIAASVGLLIFSTQRSQESARRRDAGASLVSETFSAIRTIADSNDSTSQGYNKIYCPPSGVCPGTKGPSTYYKPALVSGSWVLQAGQDTVVLSGLTYTRFLTVENVSRDSSGNIEAIYNSANDDPATQKITVTVQVPQINDLVVPEYITRWRNVAASQTDWFGGAQ